MKPTKEILAQYGLKDAAAKFNVTTRTVRRWFKEYDLYQTKLGYTPGKLNIKLATQIRHFYQTDQYTQKTLAEMFGVSQPTICRIINNKVYCVDLVLGGTAIVRFDPQRRI